MASIPTKALKVIVSDGVYKIEENGQTFDEYDFECAVRYVLECDEPIFLTWRNKETSKDFISDVLKGTRQIDLPQLTDVEHHRYATDKLVFYTYHPQNSDDYIEIGMDTSVVPYDKIEGYLGEKIEERLLNRRIVQEKQYYTDNSEQAKLNILPREDSVKNYQVLPLDLNKDNVVNRWVDNNNYIGVVLNGDLTEEKYSVQWRTGINRTHRIFFNNPQNGSIRVKTDLYHFAEGNGTTRVEFVVRPDDERIFYMNNAERSNADFFCRGIKGYENRTHIRQMFDDYILSKYPGIYNFLLMYVDQQNMRHEAASYLRNMLAYEDIDYTTEDLAKRMLRQIFTPFESVLANRRLVYKRLNDFLRNKGNPKSFKWLANVLFKKNIEVENYSDLVFRLDAAEWTQRQMFILTQKDVEALNTEENRARLGSASATTDDVAISFEGFEINGRTSMAVGVVEKVTPIFLNRTRLYRMEITVKTGTFDQDELVNLVISRNRQHILNSDSHSTTSIGIVGVEILKAGRGYAVGDIVRSPSTTGAGFEAYVTQVNKEGGIESVEIINQGWFYRQYQHKWLFVENDDNYENEVYRLGLNFVKQRNYTGKAVFFEDHIRIVQTSGFLLNFGDFTLNADNTSFTNHVIGMKLDNRDMYILPSRIANGLSLRDIGDNVRHFNILSPSPILAMSTRNRSVLVCYADRYRIYDMYNILKNANSGADLVFKEHFYNSAQTGNVIGCAMFNGDNLFFTSNNRAHRYSQDGYIESVATPIGMLGGYEFYLDGICTRTFVGSNAAYIQQFMKTNSYTCELRPVFGRHIRFAAKYKNSLNTLSSFSKLRDNDLYQEFSLVLNMPVSIEKYMATFEDMVNPAGYKYRGKFETVNGTIKGASPEIGVFEDEPSDVFFVLTPEGVYVPFRVKRPDGSYEYFRVKRDVDGIPIDALYVKDRNGRFVPYMQINGSTEKFEYLEV